MHVTPMATSIRPPAILAVSGPPRSLPDAKDSLWATERAPLEAQLPENATEGLLCTADGRALEGFVNNFFVVTGTCHEYTAHVRLQAANIALKAMSSSRHAWLLRY